MKNKIINKLFPLKYTLVEYCLDGCVGKVTSYRFLWLCKLNYLIVGFDGRVECKIEINE